MDLWEEFIVMVPMPHFQGMEVPVCGLCANTGIVDTLKTAVSPKGVQAGIRACCICPNGRALSKALKGERPA